jgi:transposase-like protein
MVTEQSRAKRPRRGRDFYRALLARQAQTGESLAAIAAENDIPASTLYLWRRKLDGAYASDAAPV